jgi:basic membrane protein A
MKNVLLLWITLILLSIQLFTACIKEVKTETIRIGLVTGVGNLNDRGFNQQAYEGLLAANLLVETYHEVKESSSVADIENNILHFANNDFDVIITLGYDAAQPTLDAANLYPSIKFLLLDHSFTESPPNLACVIYQVDQASFPCGFLAAYWALRKNPANPVVGYVAGPDIPTIRQFTSSFAAGVDYFNNQYGASVTVSGANALSFTDTLQGAHLADSLIQLGAEVIFACAGKTGNGALYKARDAGMSAIGVDTDQYETIPEVGNILLTSCMKRLGDAIITEIIAVRNSQFHGGQTLFSKLENNGVDLAPYHDFEPLIPDSIKQAILTIKQGIIDGSIDSGWK